MPEPVDAVRAFNRFYTRQIGALGERHLQSPFSLTEMRLLYELAHREAPAAAALRRDLGLDAGYVSRILRRFESRGLVGRRSSPGDRRQSLLHLTAKGRRALAPLEARAKQDVQTLLGRVAVPDRHQVVAAMGTIERLLGRPGAAAERAAPYLLRAHQPGDMGWVIHRHGAVYAREWGYDARFEALVARICADFLDHFDATGERCWIAERDQAIVGSVFLVRKSKTVAKLRLLLVEPSARGLGIGRRLVDECIRFARQAGYRTITLWTQSELDAARRLYQQAGFRCVGTERHHSFGRKNLVAETWALALSPPAATRAGARPRS
ncbi:MAG: bifunctional helix-turn-helix transcriptional regulator/GNAT family N-acetyltransferase [Vicinamibacterales bacterium]